MCFDQALLSKLTSLLKRYLNRALLFGRATKGMALYLLTKKPQPLACGLSLNNRCENNCLYCGTQNLAPIDMPYKYARSLVLDLANMGNISVTFTGGEPLLYPKLEKLMKMAWEKGMIVKINTSHKDPRAVSELKWVDKITLSLDGERKIHDDIRGAGSFDNIMKTAELCHKMGKRLGFLTVLHKNNLNSYPFVLDIAKKFDAKAIFQPIYPKLLRGNGTHNLNPTIPRLRATIDALINEKKKKRPVGNTMKNLLILRKRGLPIRCASGLFAFRFEPDFSVKGCPRTRGKKYAKNDRIRSPLVAKMKFKKPDCQSCIAATRLNMNLYLSFFQFGHRMKKRHSEISKP